VKTVAAWIKEHPGINALAFESNSDKSFGFGEREEVCGFCLASHYFDEEPPQFCKFCRVPLRDTHIISGLPEVANRVYDAGLLFCGRGISRSSLPFIVGRKDLA
jgi:hypothetical protein